MAAEQVFLGEHGDGVASNLDGATRLAIILDRHLGMNGVLNAWPGGVDGRLIDSVRRIDGPLLNRIEPILQEQLAREKAIIESHRASIEGLWLELIGRGHLTGQEIVDGLRPEKTTDLPTPKTRRKIRQRLHGERRAIMTIKSMTTAEPQKVTGWKGLSDAGHLERLETALFRARGRTRFDRAAADRFLDDLRHVAYRNGIAAAQVFQFLDQDYIDADEDLSMAQDDLHRMSRNLPFLREVAAVVEEIESIRADMSEEARILFGWRPYGGKWSSPNPLWSELRQAFQEGRDNAPVELCAAPSFS
ncbi:hypothetical protein HFO89_34415 [Rhizobium leguminosarum]|uniref:hypothetical protein n=1 Tax=Rhizobium leguminosarum TaxID=384 RepID=UPI001C97F0DF|nr:hypothetical protein [Rhizobium leguminosarum]MBY5461344.1 hypothetical protein [Rhizobium leguminosarum]